MSLLIPDTVLEHAGLSEAMTHTQSCDKTSTNKGGAIAAISQGGELPKRE